MIGQGMQRGAQQRCLAAVLVEHIRAFEQVERRERRAARERIAGVRVRMQETVGEVSFAFTLSRSIALRFPWKSEFCALAPAETGRRAGLQAHGTHLGVFGTEFLVLVRMGSRMREFVMGTLSTSRGQKMFAYDAGHFENSRTVAFHFFIDAGCLDNPAWLMGFRHLTLLWK